jgi:hypothetical protein
LLWIGCEERVIGGFEADLWGGIRAACYSTRGATVLAGTVHA